MVLEKNATFSKRIPRGPVAKKKHHDHPPRPSPSVGQNDDGAHLHLLAERLEAGGDRGQLAEDVSAASLFYMASLFFLASFF